ncbi:hypothetical protein HYALB_00006177 [Hymenoscyphus albidus]|uniref:Uncharacterized protein n=1 Tax=Hymenoscyphus albidus TaxID=595503 RepID=A0A9N9LIF3_9HELO|nr:hypothetical protein HYALB_00006177 [Hymenoscyphus albidus]
MFVLTFQSPKSIGSPQGDTLRSLNMNKSSPPSDLTSLYHVGSSRSAVRVPRETDRTPVGCQRLTSRSGPSRGAGVAFKFGSKFHEARAVSTESTRIIPCMILQPAPRLNLESCMLMVFPEGLRAVPITFLTPSSEKQIPDVVDTPVHQR